jgi:hypothetical protein
MSGPVRVPYPQRLLIPAYFSATNGKWQTTCDALVQRRATATLVMNPDSGPGVGTDADYQRAMDYCHARGQTVIGYVTTDHANRPVDDVTADIDRWYEFYPGLRGVFLDEMSNHEDDDSRAYYSELHRLVKQRSPRHQVVGNPGIAAATPWQVTTPVVDVLVVFEGPFRRQRRNDAAMPYQEWRPPSWVVSHRPGSFAHIVYESPDAATTRAICVASWRDRNAGWIYVTPDGRPNPFDEIPDAALLSSPTLHRP